jgi:Ca-activated chloride channel family protein
MRSNVNTTMALLAALGVLAAGCGGDDDESGASTAEATADDGLFPDDGSGRPGGDVSIGDTPVSGDVESDLVDGGGEATVAASDAASATASEPAAEEPAAEEPAADGGLFGDDAEAPDEPQEPDRDAEARMEDNVFEDYGYREFVDAEADPLSTFALDVDTGSYTVVRRWLDEGTLPPIEAVRPEEMINAFDYDYRAPRRGLDLSIDGGPSPFDRDHVLVRVGVQGEVVDDGDRPPAALTFVVDTSGSMDRDDRLGLVKRSLEVLVDELEPDDTVAIVTYESDAGIVLQPTPVADFDEILDAIDELEPGGSTNLEAGLRTGYALAGEAFREGGINRVVLASDGVANVGVTDPASLASMIEGDAERGIDLVTIGFGMGNYNDVTMEQLADRGDGFYAYVDDDEEAERLFEDELTSTLQTIAKDAKIQVEFDPDVVAEYRLIGFENRAVHDDDFRDDSVDAGELGAGHQVTAIYDIELARGVTVDDRGDLGTVFLRWADPASGDVEEIDDDIRLRDIEPDWADAPADLRVATVVATFAEVMRDNPYADGVDIEDLVDEADSLADELGTDEVDELAALIELAADLS